MLPPLVDIAPFCAAIEAEQLIITSNQRLAAKITQAWGERMAGTNKTVWKAPRVFAIEHWLAQCWDQLQDQNHGLVEGLAVVGKQQSSYYWERAISQQDQDLVGNYAKTAEKTLTIVKNWQLTTDQIPDSSPQVRHFKAWAANYAQLLNRNGLVTIAESWQLVGMGFENNALPREARILLYGFQSLPPLQSAILQQASPQVESMAMHSSGQNLRSEPGNQPQSHRAASLACGDSNQELVIAANWAAAELAANPEQRIGLVIPDLSNRLHASIRCISEALQARALQIPVNISAGVPLMQTPLVQAAFQLLELFRHKRPLQEWLDSLYSPYSLFAQLSVQARADIELALRACRRFEFTLDQFIVAVRSTETETETEAEPNPSNQAVLAQLLQLQHSQRQQSTGLKSFVNWAQYFDQFLNAFGWPGTRTINSLEYQQRQQWKNILEQLAELDNLNFEVGVSRAIKHLQQLAQDKVFHPQTGDAPLQVLGLLEASGLAFDQLWILGMTSQAFPASVSINPMLPAELQRQHQMPHALPQRELQIALELLTGFEANSKRLIVSYAQFKDEEQLEPSSLLRDLPELDPADFSALATPCPPWLAQQDSCQIVDDPGPVYQPTTEKIKGGASLLKNQSACPINAFAIHRLWAESLEQPRHGLSAADQGSILHEVMYRLWGQWQCSSVLQALSQQQLDQHINQAVASTLAQFATQHRVLQGPQYLQLEQQRLHKLIGQWLQEEIQRPPFEVVQREQKVSIRFGDLNLSMRLDRVDKIASKLLIIDYKTGQVTPGNWLGDRPKDPQLPLYLLASDPRANGCAFAQIQGGKIQFVGHSDSQLIEEKKPVEDWPKQLQQWQQALSNLAAEFTSGYAAMEVFDQATFRHQAPLLPFNRWYEQTDSQLDVDTSDVGSYTD
jgi:probable DNA repair protein